MATLTIKTEFSGGMELLFNNVRQHIITLPARTSADKATTMQELIFHIRDKIMTDKKELFVDDNTVRPGILVLINNVDWELCDELEYELKDKDEIVFISTLHGG
ncbi:ubiquitin-related modifier 1 [Dichotomocladium elegans]|nr:ubiquitin-related modifier 1 [Dichotomocladium elegans]